MDAKDLLHKTDPTSVIHTTGVAEQRFVDLSQTDPMAAFCFAVGVASIVLILAGVFSARLKSRFKWLGTMGGKFAIILVGAFFLLLPIAMHMHGSDGTLWPGLSQAIPAAAYFVVSITGFSGELELWTPVIHDIMGNGLLALMYYQVLCIYTVAAPLMMALTAVDIFANGFTGMLVFAESLKKCVLGRRIYVFYDLNDNTATLAGDLLSHVQRGSGHRRSSMPLLIFCNMDTGATADGNSLAQQVREQAYGCATVVFTPLGLESIPGRMAGLTQLRCETFYLVISDDTDDNVQAAIGLTDALTSQMVSWEMERRHWDVQRIGDDPGLSDHTRRYAQNIHVWCAHSNPDDDLIFDSLPHRKPDEEVVERLLRHHRGRGPKGERRRHIVDGLSPLLVRVRDLVEVRLLSEEREVVWDTLVRHPLTDVLDPVDVSTGAAPYQQLVVLVLGLGSFGREMVRATFWFGRLPGVELRIIGVDLDGGRAAGEMAASWPALMAERTPAGTPTVAADLAEHLVATVPTGADAVPTVSVVTADARSGELSDILSGGPFTATCLGDHGLEQVTQKIGPESRVYAVVCLGDDELDLDVALKVQRTLSLRVFDKTLAEAVAPSANPLVSVLVRSQEVLESVRGMAHGEERFALIPFGSTEDAFSYRSILSAPWEDAAINLEAAYDAARSTVAGTDDAPVSRVGAMESFNAYEFKKLSNRAATRFTFYRLWCLGVRASRDDVSEELEAHWLAKLGVGDTLQRLGMGDDEAMELLCGHRFGDHRTFSAEDRKARVAELADADAALRGRYPTVCAMADLEHARWCAFLRANGWGGAGDDFEELQRLVAFAGIHPKEKLPYPHESSGLLRHYYLVDDPATFRDHGAECRDDPAAYDRLVTVEALRVLRRGFMEPIVPGLGNGIPGIGAEKARNGEGTRAPKGPNDGDGTDDAQESEGDGAGD